MLTARRGEKTRRSHTQRIAGQPDAYSRYEPSGVRVPFYYAPVHRAWLLQEIRRFADKLPSRGFCACDVAALFHPRGPGPRRDIADSLIEQVLRGREFERVGTELTNSHILVRWR